MKLFLIILISYFLSLISPVHIYAQAPHTQTPSASEERYYEAKVIDIKESGEKEISGFKNFFQKIEVEIRNGTEKGKKVTLEHGGIFNITPIQILNQGDTVIIIKSVNSKGDTAYSILDRYRLHKIIIMVLGFFVLVIVVAGKKGLGAIVGLGVSLLIILKFIVPQILAGNDPLLISIIGSLGIMLTTIYLAHGFSRQTTVAVLSTFLSLCLTALFSFMFVKAAVLSGLGTEDSFLLQFGPQSINLQGLLLGGMIIGALGVLDDITTTQTAAVFELAKTDKRLEFADLVKKGFTIGKEHIVSLVNTLVLAYAGASLAIFILLELNPAKQPYWVILNSEVITEEIVRTLAGSMGLVLAVPIATLLAAFVCKYKVKFS